MRGDLPLAAQRLLASCTVRTVEAREIRTYGERVGQQKSIQIEGHTFNSVKEARRVLGYGWDRIARLLKNGSAKYVE